MNLLLPLLLILAIAFGVGCWRVGARESARIIGISCAILVALVVAFFIWFIVALSMSPTNWPN